MEIWARSKEKIWAPCPGLAGFQQRQSKSAILTALVFVHWGFMRTLGSVSYGFSHSKRVLSSIWCIPVVLPRGFLLPSFGLDLVWTNTLHGVLNVAFTTFVKDGRTCACTSSVRLFKELNMTGLVQTSSFQPLSWLCWGEEHWGAFSLSSSVSLLSPIQGDLVPLQINLGVIKWGWPWASAVSCWKRGCQVGPGF